MKTLIIILILLTTLPAYARNRGGHPGYSGGHNSGDHRSHYRHYAGYVGDRTPSGYYGRSRGVLNIDHAHESAPPDKSITSNPYYRGVDKHGALRFGD